MNIKSFQPLKDWKLFINNKKPVSNETGFSNQLRKLIMLQLQMEV